MRAKSLYVVSSPRLASRPEKEEEEEAKTVKEKEDSLTYVIHGHTVYKHCSQVSQCKHYSQGSQCSQVSQCVLFSALAGITSDANIVCMPVTNFALRPLNLQKQL